MKVVIAGSSGLIGSALTAALRADGHRVVRLVRRTPNGDDECRWDPQRGTLDPTALPDADAAVNFCGVGIGDRRWTGAYKQALRDSRLVPTDVLATAVAKTGVPTLINAGGVNYYAADSDEPATESAPNGSGFLAQLCRDWEAATAPAVAAGTRVVLLRNGVVLSRRGGMLAKLRPLFRLGLGGRLGSGRQLLPWISLDDQVAALKFLLQGTVAGPVNMVGPTPATNAEFTTALGAALRRPTRLSVPAVALRAALGSELAQQLLLSGPRAIPTALQDAGFTFQHTTIDAALAAVTA